MTSDLLETLPVGTMFWTYWNRAKDQRPDLRQIAEDHPGWSIVLVNEDGELRGEGDGLTPNDDWIAGVSFKPIPIGSDEEAIIIGLLALAPSKVLERFVP